MKNSGEGTLSLLFKTLIFIIILRFSYLLVFRKTPYIFIDNTNLLIHEAGHLIFTPFGDFVSTLGGSINQLLVPTVFTLYFLIKRNVFAISFTIFWLGENLINISYYIVDARSRVLPLVGGGTHDWLYILTKMNWLDKSDLLGKITFYLGSGIIIFSLAASFSYLFLNIVRKIRALK